MGRVAEEREEREIYMKPMAPKLRKKMPKAQKKPRVNIMNGLHMMSKKEMPQMQRGLYGR